MRATAAWLKFARALCFTLAISHVVTNGSEAAGGAGISAAEQVSQSPGEARSTNSTRLAANALFDQTGVFINAASAFPSERYAPLLRRGRVAWLALQIDNGGKVRSDNADALEHGWATAWRAAGFKVGFWGAPRGVARHNSDEALVAARPLVQSDAALAVKLTGKYGGEFYLADCEDSYQAYNGKDPAPALNRVYVEAFEAAAKAAGLEKMARALSSEGRIALDMKPWIEAGWDAMPQAYWNAYAVYQPSKCVDFYSKEAGWPLERIHPTIGTFTSEGEKRVVSLEQYDADLKTRSTVGFSFYLPESYLTQTNVDGYEQLGRMSRTTPDARSNSFDEFIERLMVERDIPGLSLAIIHGGELVKARGYGLADRASRQRVTTSTLFQAASVSKPVAGLAALHLVDQGKLSLDADVNSILTTWKVPQNEFTKSQPVTLRRILSHRAGFILHGFPGYAVDAALPSLEQILDGAAPANTHPIRVYYVPGSKSAYSGGGYLVMQQMLTQVVQEPVPRYFEQTVLEPFGMTNSTFEQPLSKRRSAAAATGYGADGNAVEGKWHVYPELAAAGLWTTATDLARFAMGIQRSLAGTANPVLSQAMTREMLTDQGDHDGLGLFLQGSGKDLRFWHSGRNEGFDTLLMALAHRGDGAVVMINRNDNSRALAAIFRRIAQEYHWARPE